MNKLNFVSCLIIGCNKLEITLHTALLCYIETIQSLSIFSQVNMTSDGK